MLSWPNEENFDMKNIFVVILILTLAQAACNLPQTVAAQTTPSLPTAVEVVAALPASATAPVSTDTPSADTSTPEATQAPAATLTETPSPTATLTETPSPVKLFSGVTLSAQVISPICPPKTVHFEVTPTDSKTYSVVLFIRLHYKTVGDRTSWNEGFAMKPVGGKFIYDLNASNIKDFNKYKDPVAWVQFQLVAMDSDGIIIGRSEVFTDKLTIFSVCS
jgi:hypothetical protein